jgi:hypothetical protein
MPYTVKAVTKWADSTLPADQQMAKLKELSQHDFTTNFDVTAVTALRKAATADGDMLARGAVLLPDSLELITTTVWKSQVVYTAFAQNPAMVAYLAAMAAGGWDVTITAV